MDRIWLGIALLLPFVIGLAKLIHSRTLLSQIEIFAREFMDKLRLYIESDGADTEVYGWLIHRSNRMQHQLGLGGLIAAYRPPFANFQYKNYPVILNILPELRKTLENDLLSRGHLARDYAMLLQETLIRHLGTLSDSADKLSKSIKNPIAWFREGVHLIITLPLSFLTWAGILSSATVGRITSGRFFSGLSGIAGLVGLISAVMGIALGWGQFVDLVTSWWKKFF